MNTLLIRHAEPGDLEAMTRLYNRFVETTAVTFDTHVFTVGERKDWLAKFGGTGRHQLFVAKLDGAFAGYAGSMRFRDKRAYDTSVETTIYVEEACARSGVGRALYQRLFAALAIEDVHRAYAGIALPNEASIEFHLGFGFKEIGTFHEVGRKFGRYHDVTWFEKRLS